MPARPPKLVYLDMNHWIALSKAISGHRDGHRFIEPLEVCLDARGAGRATFPISDAILIEASKIGPYRQRHNLRVVIEALSGFHVVAARPVISAHEIEAVLDSAVGPNPNPLAPNAYLDWGVLRAIGRDGRLRIHHRDTGEDVTSTVRASWRDGPEAFDQFVADGELSLQRKVLEGPSPEEEPGMRAKGWRPEGAHAIADNRARQEIEQVKVFDKDPIWRRGRIRDVIAARELLIEINEPLYRGLHERGVAAGEILSSPEASRSLLDAMPSFDVAVTIKTAYHRNRQHRWTVNDIHDIDALGSTLPYCDIVVTDKAVATQAVVSGLAHRLGTDVLYRLADLPSHISGANNTATLAETPRRQDRGSDPASH
jgi:hypothetical protein